MSEPALETHQLTLLDPDRLRPLILTGDPVLLDDLLRVAAAAGVEPEVATDVVAARARWQAQPLVVVGADVGGQLHRARLPARPGVLVVGRTDTDITVWRSGIALGATGVLCLPSDEAELCSRLADAAEGPVSAAPVLCVVGGCGGAGASSVAVAIALAATRRRYRATLIDADPLGGGLDLLFGAEDADGVRWSALTGSRGRISGTALHAALPEVRAVRVLSYDLEASRSIPAEAMTAVVDASQRVSDAVIVDLPRHPDEAATVPLACAAAVFIVVPARVRAVAAASRVAALVRRLTPNAHVLVRAGARSSLTGAFVAGHLGLPLAGVFAPERAIDIAMEHGEPPGRSRRGPLSRLGDQLAGDFVSARTGPTG